MVKELDQPILDAEADWKALVERGAGDPLRDDQERGGHGLVSRHLHRASLHSRAGPDVEEPPGLSGRSAISSTRPAPQGNNTATAVGSPVSLDATDQITERTQRPEHALQRRKIARV
jgi:hypothetical protein